MKDEIITPITESQLAAIDEEKLPQIFRSQVRLLEKANQEYSLAGKKEQEARRRVATALKEADDLIDAAKHVGGHTAETKKFLGAEWTSKRDEIDTLKTNLKEIIKHSADSAEAQKKLAEVQASLMESQTAILQVQKAHMEYQRQIADATKFVFGLSAYNMGVSQSIYLNLKAVLSNESPEKMGELAQQQLFLALDQIRNQESLITRIKENDDRIESLGVQIAEKRREIAEICQVDQEQDRLIAEGIEKDQQQDVQISQNAQDIDALEQQGAEQRRLIEQMAVTDEAQDALIAQGVEKDAEHDKLLAQMAATDEAQDALIAQGVAKDARQDEKLADLQCLLDEQTKRLDLSVKEMESLNERLAIMEITQKKTGKIILALSIGLIVTLALGVLQFLI